MEMVKWLRGRKWSPDTKAHSQIFPEFYHLTLPRYKLIIEKELNI